MDNSIRPIAPEVPGIGPKTEYSHPVAPRSIGEIDGAAPVIRDTDDFKVTAGNTTWPLHDVYFDTPDPDAGPAYRYTQKPIGP